MKIAQLPPPAADRNLLFGVLALQLNFIDRDALVAAMHAWVLEKNKPLGQILRDQGRLDAGQLQALDGLLTQHVAAHGNDPRRSLQALDSTASVRPLLIPLADTDVQAALLTLTPAPADNSTCDYSAASSNGSRFRIVRSHAKGGLGEVFVAEDTELHREVALKEIQLHRANDLPSRTRFVMEAEITGGLEHPGIVPVYGLGAYRDGRPYYAMRFIRGESLRQAIDAFHVADVAHRNAGQRAEAFRRLLRRLIDVCNAIAYAHSRGVLHRDLKPSNVMLGKYGETLVVDWGLAKPGIGSRHAAAAPSELTADPSLRPSSGSGLLATQAGSAVGTPGYMSPEQAAGRLHELGPASDIYSLGATLFTLLTGHKPGAEMDGKVAIDSGPDKAFPTFSPVKRATPPALDAICRKAMAANPAQRYVTAQELAADLECWLADEPVSAYPEPWPARAARWARRHRTAIVAAGVLLLTAIVALSVSTALLWQEKEKTKAQKVLAEGNAARALELSFGGIGLIEAAEPRYASSPQLQAVRKATLLTAAKTFRLHLAQRPDDLELRAKAAQVYRYTANVHRLEDETAAAEALHQEAIGLYEKFIDEFPEDGNYRLGLAGTLRDYATVQARLGRLRDAGSSLDRAIKLTQALPDSAGSRRALATALLSRANNEYQHGQHAAAARTASDSVDRLRVLASGPPRDTHPYDLLLLAAGIDVVAASERESGRIEDARQAHYEAIDILTGLEKSPPEGMNHNDAVHFLGCCHIERCRTLANDPARRETAEKNFGFAALPWAALAGNFPNVPMYREWRAVALQERGRLRVEDGRFAAARPDLEQARDLQEKLAADYSQIPSFQGDLGRTYLGLSQLAKAAGDPNAATDWRKKAAAALSIAVERSPDRDRDRRSLAEAR